MILLDTNVVIAFFNGNQEVLEKIQADIGRIALSTLVVAELDYGAKASQKAKENIEKLHRFVDIVRVVPFDLECAKIFGTIKTNFESWVSQRVKWMHLLQQLRCPTRLFLLQGTESILKILRV